jgi:hypothetical protein
MSSHRTQNLSELTTTNEDKKSTIKESISINNNNKTTKNTENNHNLKTVNQNIYKPNYVDFLNIRKKSFYPFGLTEKRFKWQNLEDRSNPIQFGDNTIKNRIKRKKIKNYFEGGFKKFYSKKDLDENKKFHKSYDNNTSFNKNHFYLDTKRVILSNFNNDKLDFTYKFKKKRIKEMSNSEFHSSGGSIESLFNRTPINFELKKGKKHFFLENSFDNKKRKNNKFLYKNSNISNINLFSYDYGKIEKVRNVKKFINKNYIDNVKLNIFYKKPKSIFPKSYLKIYLKKYKNDNKNSLSYSYIF